MDKREQMSKKQAEEFVRQNGPYAARSAACRADDTGDPGTADALWEAAERADGGKSTWPF